ncbi:MAG: alanine racemase [Anaerolineaceae bacterium]|nr:alanine racemase [Anaerolineaceae bacterium]
MLEVIWKHALLRFTSRFILRAMSDGFSTWLEIDLEAIRNNIRLLRRITGTPIMAVVKANGYGHGAKETARACVEAGADWCGVARFEEAMALRKAGLNCRILVMGYTPPANLKNAINNNISLTIYDLELGETYPRMIKKSGGSLNIHIKVDTGMGRLGIRPEDALKLVEDLSACPGICVEGFCTHLSKADETDRFSTLKQLEIFTLLVETLQQQGMRPEIVHAANSAAALQYPESRFDLIRPGIAVYGLNPSNESPLPAGFMPALTWKARLTSKKVLPPGHMISYGGIYTTQSEEQIGVVPVGYADGFRRVAGEQVLLHGRRVDVVGRVCMDQCMIQISDLSDVQIGDEVILMGDQAGESISADEIARRWGTINYEVVCGLSNRLPRIYLG